MASVRWVDFAVICVYVLGLTGIGLRFPAARPPPRGISPPTAPAFLGRRDVLPDGHDHQRDLHRLPRRGIRQGLGAADSRLPPGPGSSWLAGAPWLQAAHV